MGLRATALAAGRPEAELSQATRFVHRQSNSPETLNVRACRSMKVGIKQHERRRRMRKVQTTCLSLEDWRQANPQRHFRLTPKQPIFWKSWMLIHKMSHLKSFSTETYTTTTFCVSSQQSSKVFLFFKPIQTKIAFVAIFGSVLKLSLSGHSSI